MAVLNANTVKMGLLLNVIAQRKLKKLGAYFLVKTEYKTRTAV